MTGMQGTDDVPINTADNAAYEVMKHGGTRQQESEYELIADSPNQPSAAKKGCEKEERVYEIIPGDTVL